MKAIILAGGKGTRLGSLTKKIPKPLIKIGEKPVIEHQVELLKEYGFKDILVLAGYLGEQIKNYLGDGKKWGIKIRYYKEDKPLGTAGALKLLEKEAKDWEDKDFLVFSGDVMLNFDIKRFVAWHKISGKSGVGSIIVHPNDHPFDSDLVEINNKGKIVALLKRPHEQGKFFQNLSIAAVFIFSTRIFKYMNLGKKMDIEKDLLPVLFKNKEKIYAYKTSEYLKDMGSKERLRAVRKDYKSGKIKKLNLKNKRAAIFIDRDGVVNKEVDQLSKIEDFNLYSFTGRAIKKINNSEYITVLITNQPMIAKGFMSEKELAEIHKKLETKLGLVGAKIDAIYYCPHHPEKGFVGERAEMKIKCKCRKPAPGLFIKAAKDLNIDLRKSYSIGDKTSDIIAGKRAGCKTVLVKTGYGGKDKKFLIKPNFIANNLFGAVKKIIS